MATGNLIKRQVNERILEVESNIERIGCKIHTLKRELGFAEELLRELQQAATVLEVLE